MNNFSFHIPTKVYFGKDCIENLQDECSNSGKTVLLVYGGGSIKRNGVYDRINSLLSDDHTIIDYGNVEPNPKIEHIREGVRICKERGVDFDPWDFFGAPRKPINDALPLFTVVTMASTGSEMSCGAVITNNETGEKTGRNGFPIFPKASFLDPVYSFSLSEFQTCCGSADILSHLIENYFKSDLEFDMLERMMEGLIKSVIINSRIVKKEPDNYEARGSLLWAASWAINGFFVGGSKQIWTCHPIEHELSAMADITHGLGMAILMPKWLKYCYSHETENIYKKFSQNVFGKDNPYSGIEMLEAFLYHEIGLNQYIDSKIIDKSKVDEIAMKVCKNGPLKGFVEIDEAAVNKILLDCYK